MGAAHVPRESSAMLKGECGNPESRANAQEHGNSLRQGDILRLGSAQVSREDHEHAYVPVGHPKG